MRNSVLGQNGNLWVRKSAKANGQQAFPDYFPVKVRGMRQTTGGTAVHLTLRLSDNRTRAWFLAVG